MDRLEALGNSAIIVEISSEGGSAYDALAFVGRMRNSPCDVYITAFGYVASAAVIILAAADHRAITAESWVMVHEDSGKINGHVFELERQAAHLRRMEKQWNGLLARYTKASEAAWADMHKATTHLTAVECLNLGLVDEII